MSYNSPNNRAVVVQSLAATAGVTITDLGRDTLDKLLEVHGDFQPGSLTVQDDTGQSVAVSDWFAGQMKTCPAFFEAKKPADPPPSKPAGTMTERGIAANAARKADRSAEAEALFSKFGNPWTAGRENRTHQAFITNTNETLANRLRQEAGR